MSYYRDTWAEVNLDAIYENVTKMLNRLPQDVKMIAVVKANGYGHGDYEIAKTALEAGASYLAVAFLDEGLALRKKGIKAPILILGATRPEDVNLAAENELTLTVFQENWLKEAIEILDKDSPLSIHLKIDTGMGRLGIKTKEELQSIEALAEQDERIQINGAYTHFATADEKDLTLFHKQFHRFQEMIRFFNNKPNLIHASNSAASLREIGSFFNGIRYGISMYGLAPSSYVKEVLPFPLKEAFSLKTKVVHVKKIMPGETISYGATYEAKEEEWIGTLPIGYADGWIRKLQGQEVLINGMRAEIVGRICMDQCMIKLPFQAKVGTVVTLIGQDGDDQITIDEIADRLETINYEIPCMITNRVPRVYMKKGEIVKVKNFLL